MGVPQEFLETRLASELPAGERLLWVGRPKSGIRLGIRFSGALVCATACLASLCWDALDGYNQLVGWTVPFLGLRVSPFVAGLALFGPVVALLLVEVWVIGSLLFDREATCYGISDSCIFIVSGIGWWRRTTRFRLNEPFLVDLHGEPGGRGSIVFKLRRSVPGWPGRMRGFEMFWEPTFEHVDNARDVYDAIRSRRTA
jgi:hypothetical protein